MSQDSYTHHDGDFGEYGKVFSFDAVIQWRNAAVLFSLYLPY